MTLKVSTSRVRRLIGNPTQVAQELKEFSANVKALEKDASGLIKRYPNYYLAFYRRKRVALSKTLPGIFVITDKLNIPRSDLAIMKLSRDTLVLCS